jgi:hypothetical protein
LKPTWAKKKQGPISKTPTQNMAGGVTQVVEHLPSKGEDLSSNPSASLQKNTRQFAPKLMKPSLQEKSDPCCLHGPGVLQEQTCSLSAFCHSCKNYYQVRGLKQHKSIILMVLEQV